MIDKKNLMIGDWIQLNNSIYPTKWTARDYSAVDRAFDANPIKITEKFVSNNRLNYRVITKGYNEWRLTITFENNRCYVEIEHFVDDAHDYYIERFPIEFVHDLQHLLRASHLDDIADNLKID